MKSIKYFLPTIVWILFIAWLCFTPAEEIVSYDWLDIFKFDKLGHAGIFAILVFLTAWSFKLQQNFQNLKKSALSFAFFFAIFYSGLIEIVQEQWIPTRTGEWIDFIADVVGCVLGLIGYWIFERFIIRNVL